MTLSLHTFRLLPPAKEEERGPLGEDGEFGEDVELQYYMSEEEILENWATNSFEIYVESS